MLVTELCRGGNLFKFLFQSRVSDNSTPNNVNIISTLTNHQLLEMAVHVASGMAHLSAQKVDARVICYNEVFNSMQVFHVRSNVIVIVSMYSADSNE